MADPAAHPAGPSEPGAGLRRPLPAIGTSGWISADAWIAQHRAAASVGDVRALDAVMRLNTAIGLERGPLTTALAAAQLPTEELAADQAKTHGITLLAAWQLPETAGKALQSED